MRRRWNPCQEVAILDKELAILHKEVAILHKEVAILHKEVGILHKEGPLKIKTEDRDFSSPPLLYFTTSRLR